ncbi:MAG: hypothetical protein KDK70_25490 [Myxococcales bacterium]|nr:hypothetical protein [Myxococcales bacterium]
MARRREPLPTVTEQCVRAEYERLERLVAADPPYRPEWLQQVQAAWQRHQAEPGAGAASFRRSAEYRQLVQEEAARPVSPPSLYVSAAMDRARQGDRGAVATVLAYLDLSPRYFASGYLKEELLRGLRGVALDEEQRAVLRRVFLRWILVPGREYGRFVGLLPQLRTAEFDAAIEALAEHDHEHVRRRARRLVEAWWPERRRERERRRRL